MAQVSELDAVATPAVKPAKRPRAVLRSLGIASLIPWAVVLGLWELVFAEGWVTTSLFPPPSAWIGYAIESNFQVGFARDAMTLPFAILSDADFALTRALKLPIFAVDGMTLIRRMVSTLLVSRPSSGTRRLSSTFWPPERM